MSTVTELAVRYHSCDDKTGEPPILTDKLKGQRREDMLQRNAKFSECLEDIWFRRNFADVVDLSDSLARINKTMNSAAYGRWQNHEHLFWRSRKHKPGQPVTDDQVRTRHMDYIFERGWCNVRLVNSRYNYSKFKIEDLDVLC